jgi:hypothetical protein
MIEMDTQQEWRRRNIFISFASRLSQSLFDSIILLIIQYHAQSSPLMFFHGLIELVSLFCSAPSVNGSRRTVHLVRGCPSSPLTSVWTLREQWASFRRTEIIHDTCRVFMRLHCLYAYMQKGEAKFDTVVKKTTILASGMRRVIPLIKHVDRRQQQQ